MRQPQFYAVVLLPTCRHRDQAETATQSAQAAMPSLQRMWVASADACNAVVLLSQGMGRGWRPSLVGMAGLTDKWNVVIAAGSVEAGRTGFTRDRCLPAEQAGR